MPTDDQRQVIEAEEQLRHEVRRRLDTRSRRRLPRRSGRQQIDASARRYSTSSTARSACWLLSSVVLTGGAALLQNIQHNHEIAQQNRQQLSTHRFEITHRL